MRPRGRAAALCLGALLFTALCVWIAAEPNELHRDTFRWAVATFLGLPCFGLGALWAGLLALRPWPLLVINDEGITDRSTVFAVGLIPWDDIVTLSPSRAFGGGSLAVLLRPQSLVVAQQGLPIRLWYRLSMWLYPGTVFLGLRLLPDSGRGVLARIADAFGDQIAHGGIVLPKELARPRSPRYSR